MATKAELIAKGKTLGLKLDPKMLKADMETSISKAEKPAKSASRGSRGEY